MSNDAEIKKLNDKIDALGNEHRQLVGKGYRGQAEYESNQNRKEEIKAEIWELRKQLAEAQGKAIAGAIGKGA